jgi:hypothetical protein
LNGYFKHSFNKIRSGYGTIIKQSGDKKEKKNLQDPSARKGSKLPQTTGESRTGVFQNESGVIRKTSFLSALGEILIYGHQNT